MSTTDENEKKNGEPHPPAAKPREKRKTFSIPFRGWNAQQGTRICSVVPNDEEIKKSVEVVNSGKFEERVFDSKGLNDQFNEESRGDFAAYCSVARAYHAARTAYFVVKGWKDSPIEVFSNGHMRDGQHRLLAAMYLRLDEVDVIVFEA